jgi:hypothetical protein
MTDAIQHNELVFAYLNKTCLNFRSRKPLRAGFIAIFVAGHKKTARMN